MTTFFTADTHAYHHNIIRHCNRPWGSADEMTEALANNINEVVGLNDTLYHLGDFAWGHPKNIERFRGLINCSNVHLMYGNHDKVIRKHEYLRSLFDSVNDLLTIKTPDNQKIVLCHYAMRTWNCAHHGAWHLYGHSHGNLPEIPRFMSFDVGVDAWQYQPISLSQIKERMNEKKEAAS